MGAWRLLRGAKRPSCPVAEFEHDNELALDADPPATPTSPRPGAPRKKGRAMKMQYDHPQDLLEQHAQEKLAFNINLIPEQERTKAANMKPPTHIGAPIMVVGRLQSVCCRCAKRGSKRDAALSKVTSLASASSTTITTPRPGTKEWLSFSKRVCSALL